MSLFWGLLHTVIGLAAMAISLFMLTRWREGYLLAERVGLGLIAGAGSLRLLVLWDRQASPFDPWAPTLFTLGLALLLGARAFRDWRHERANIRQREVNRKWLEARGKL